MPPYNIAPDIWFPNLRLYFENVPRVVFSPFGFDIYWYAVFIVLGITAAYFLAVWYAKRTKQNPGDYLDLLLLGVPMAFIGLRTYFLIFNWDNYRGQNFFRVFFDIRGGGLAIYGGIIGALLAGVIMSFVKKIPFTRFADTCAPSLLIGQIIGRFGNFFNREAFGGYTDNLFAMRIRLDQAMGVRPDLLDTVIHANGESYLQVHPTFLYEAFFNLILMIILMVYRPYKKFEGEVILLYLLGYGIIRFFVEGLRTDQLMFFDSGLPASQIISVVFVVLSLALIITGRVFKRHKR